VRSPGEFAGGTITGAINIPVDVLRNKLDALPKNQTVLVFCKVGLRGYIACRILAANGFTNCVNLSGGYETYRAVAGEIP
jgi:rhodanese-related sulfurtransferase